MKSQKTVKDLNFSSTSYFFISDFYGRESFRRIYLKLDVSLWSKNSYIPELFLNYILFKAQTKFHMNIWDGINITKFKVKKSVLMFWIIELKLLLSHV